MAQYRLGKMIYQGDYYRQMPENAAYWLILSAKQNNPYAEMLLGQLYILGDFLRLDKKAGFGLLYDAISDANAAYTLGKYYAEGKHLKKNIPKAIALLEQAAQMGNPFAEYRLAKIYPFESDYFDWHEHGSTQGQRKRLPGIAEYEPQSCFSITTRIADLIGDLSATFDKRPAVKDCTTMPQRKERKKYEYEQCM